MDADHIVKQGDTPVLRWSLQRDLGGVTALQFLAFRPGHLPVIDREMVIVDSATGEVTVQLEAEDTAQPAYLHAIVRETTADGQKYSSPSEGYVTLWIQAAYAPTEESSSSE